ncbi:MAG: GGDEF domain-containing protein [Clostridia bacterium]|nr:GGDEF domain-containing protein [Clostridia bacterium]
MVYNKKKNIKRGKDMSMGFNLRNFILFIIGIFLLILLIPNNIVLEKLGLESILYHQVYHFEEQLMNLGNHQNEIDIMAANNIQNIIGSTILFGAMLSLIVFNAVLSIRMIDKNHFFVFALFCIILLFEMSYSGVMYFLNENIDKFLSTSKLILLNIIIILMMVFARTYLDFSSYNEKIYKSMTVFVVLPFISIFFFFIGMTYLAVLLTCILIIISSLYLLKVCIYDIRENNSRNTKFFIAVLLSLLIGGGISFAAGMRYIENNYFTDHVFELTSTIAILIISYALSGKLFLLQQTNKELMKSEHSLTLLSLTDELTKLYNRRYFNERLKYEVEQAHISGKALTLLLVDIDYFKNFNDTYGHHEGDKALAKLGKIILENIRQTDYACRYGGEEFGIILPNTSKIKADKYVADRLHKTLEKSVFAFTRKGKVFITVSIGICELQSNDSAETLLEHADEALYKAKTLGRNRTVIYNTRWAKDTSQ